MLTFFSSSCETVFFSDEEEEEKFKFTTTINFYFILFAQSKKITKKRLSKNMGETVIKSGPMIKRSQNKKKWSLVNYKNRWFELSRSFIIYYDNCEGGREVRFFDFIIFFSHVSFVMFSWLNFCCTARSTPVHVFLSFALTRTFSSVSILLIFFTVSGVPFQHLSRCFLFTFPIHY